MITTVLNRITAAATFVAVAVATAWVAFVGFVTEPAPALASVRTRRGAGFLEWALLAALALAIAAILWAVFPGAFSGLLNRIRDGINRT